MAALLRSARLLKISHSPLLRVTGGHRHAATAGAVYSRAACRRAAGPSGALGSLSPYSSASVCSTLRYYGTTSEQKGEVAEEPSAGIRNTQADNFDWALSKLDNSVRRTGRITKTLLQKIFQDICRKGYPSGNQALLLLRSCGSLLPEVPLQERTEFAHHVWEKLKTLGVAYDVSHYNALLKVYLQNEFKFSPTDFLAKMEAANVQPNRVTYQRLLAAYCQDGDIEGASKILAFMKSKDLPVTEAVFNSLVTGHSRAGDLESAANILSVMRGAGIEPSSDTYVTLLCAYAENGDITKIKETIETLQNMGTNLVDRELMQVAFSLAKAGHQQHAREILELVKHDIGYIPEAMNLCLSLITLGMEDTAFSVLRSFPILKTESPIEDSLTLGNFFLRHCVNMNKSVEKLVFFCNGLKDVNFHSSPLQFTLHCALESKNTAMAVGLMKVMKKEGFPIRPHYFWPLLVQHQKDKDTAGMVEVLKAMQELDVVPDIDTYSLYVVGTFPSLDKAQAALQEVGFDVHTSDFVSAVVRFEAAKRNLSELYSLMSNPSFPVIELHNFRTSLISGFLGSSDVESMAKITELLYKDSRYVKEGTQSTDNVAYFLYNLFKAMDEEKTSEKKLIKYIEELKKRDITIPENIYKGITKILRTYNMSALNEHVYALVDNRAVTAAPDTTTPLLNDLTENVLDLEKKLKEFKFQGRPANTVFKQLIKVLCDKENLSHALDLKTRNEDLMTIGCYAFLIKLCIKLDNLDLAMKLKKEVNLKCFEANLDDNIYMNLVSMLSKNNRLDEAEDLLKEIKEKNVQLRSIKSLFHTLNEHGLKGDTTTVQRLQDAMFTLGLVNPSSNLCSPLIISYLEREDLTGALDAVIECNKLYQQLPRLHQVICALINKGDTELLQKAMDFVRKERGEMMMMYELLFGFLWTGRYKEARKIAETPGLRAKPGRLQWFAEKCISSQKMEALENMVDMTAKLFECDRDEMYHYLLCLCKITNNWQKAEAVWMKMQEENVIPREKTLILLADIFKSNQQPVPFEVPEVWYEQPEAKKESSKVEESPTLSDSPLNEASNDDYKHKVQKLCKKGEVMAALIFLKKAESKNIKLPSSAFDILIRALLSQGNLEDALAVKDLAVRHMPEFKLSDKAASLLIVTQARSGKLEDALAGLKDMVQAEQVPMQLAIRQVLQGLAKQGDVKGIQEVQDTVGALCQSMNVSSVSFMNSTALAHITNGDLDSAVEVLESVYSRQQSAASVFRAVLTANDEKALDKLSAMAERLCNQFALYRPATDLFIQYLDLGKTEEAKFLLQRCAAIAEQRNVLTSYMSKSSNVPGKAASLKNLKELVPDFINQNSFCCYLMKCYVVDKDLSSAKALYQQMQDDGIQVDELSLKRLAKMYTDAGETVPFEVPQESFKFYADKLKISQAQETAEN
uniref:PROP1-like PPR domain-containing protein n=1 Tax=Astyanax mexicanus TaxID=7994 RepID=A0A8B9LJ13_ASTMX